MLLGCQKTWGFSFFQATLGLQEYIWNLVLTRNCIQARVYWSVHINDPYSQKTFFSLKKKYKILLKKIVSIQVAEWNRPKLERKKNCFDILFLFFAITKHNPEQNNFNINCNWNAYFGILFCIVVGDKQFVSLLGSLHNWPFWSQKYYPKSISLKMAKH